MKELLTSTKYNVYCLIRAVSKKKAKERLKEKIEFYFDDDFYDKYENRIIIINGDFTQVNFGLNIKDYKEVTKKAKVLINSAACVKHYGNTEYFYNINYLSVKKALDFCKQENKQFVQISTMSIFSDCKSDSIDEKTLYRNQNLDNIYIRTKFEAEQLIAAAIDEGVCATIFRLGNIMWREDGKFQDNEDENSFILKLKSILKYKIISKDVLNYKIDLSPVDLCAKSILILLQNNRFNVYHIENDNKITIGKLIELINQIGIKVDILNNDEYIKILSNLANDNELIAIVENNLNAATVKSEKTIQELREKGFNWNKITEEYLKKYILDI